MVKNTVLVKKIIYNQKSIVRNPQKDTKYPDFNNRSTLLGTCIIWTNIKCSSKLTSASSGSSFGSTPNSNPDPPSPAPPIPSSPYKKKFHDNTIMLYIRWIHTHHIKSIMLGVQHPMHVISTSNYQYWTKAAIVNWKLSTITQLH